MAGLRPERFDRPAPRVAVRNGISSRAPTTAIRVQPEGRHGPNGEANERETGVARLARQEVKREIRSVARGRVEVELKGEDRAIVYVDENDTSYVIGKGGERISAIEDRLGINIDARTHGERQLSTEGGEMDTGYEMPSDPSLRAITSSFPWIAIPVRRSRYAWMASTSSRQRSAAVVRYRSRAER